MDDWQTYLVLCLSAAAGGAVNSVAGGGTLLTFPAVYAALGNLEALSVIANATSTVALFPGSLSACWGYRREMRDVKRWSLLLVGPSLLGGMIGTWLVVKQPPETFAKLVPWLILLAASLFALQPQITKWTGIGQAHEPVGRGVLVGVIFFQLLVGIYGGYFGAGIGILMLSSLAMMGLADIHRMNALKTLLASLINGTSVAIFLANGPTTTLPATERPLDPSYLVGSVYWPYGVAMAIAAIIGGFIGASVARRLDKRLVRGCVVVIGFVLAGWYFYKQMAG